MKVKLADTPTGVEYKRPPWVVSSPLVTDPYTISHQISTRGYAYGYIGGGLLLLVHLILIQAFYNSEYSDLVTRLAIISVGVWWFGWSIWTIKVVPEPTIEKVAKKESVLRLILSAFGRLRQTFGEVRKYKYLFRLLEQM